MSECVCEYVCVRVCVCVCVIMCVRVCVCVCVSTAITFTVPAGTQRQRANVLLLVLFVVDAKLLERVDGQENVTHIRVDCVLGVSLFQCLKL